MNLYYAFHLIVSTTIVFYLIKHIKLLSITLLLRKDYYEYKKIGKNSDLYEYTLSKSRLSYVMSINMLFRSCLILGIIILLSSILNYKGDILLSIFYLLTTAINLIIGLYLKKLNNKRLD